MTQQPTRISPSAPTDEATNPNAPQRTENSEAAPKIKVGTLIDLLNREKFPKGTKMRMGNGPEVTLDD